MLISFYPSSPAIAKQRHQYKISINNRFTLRSQLIFNNKNKGMDKLAKHHQMHNIFDIVKFRFPHIEFQTLNPQLSFSQNLHNIIIQLGLPSSAFQVNHQISNMKDAVDRQELKIQTSLVNDENVDITNRAHRKSYNKISQQDIDDEMSENSHEIDYQSLVLKQATTRNHDYQSHQIMEEIWMFDSLNANGNADWFQT